MTRRPRPVLRFQKKQYAKGRFQNPYFRRVPPRLWKRFLPWVIALCLFLCFFFWIFFGSPLFRIQKVLIEGGSEASTVDLSTRVEMFLQTPRFLVFRSRNRWLFNAQVCQTYLEQYYAFNTIHFSFPDLHSLVISVQEKASSLLWETGGQFFIVDLQGNVVRALTFDEQSWFSLPVESLPETQKSFVSLPKFRDLNDAPVTPGLTVATPEEIQTIFAFQKTLESLGVPFTETHIDRLSGKWIGILTQAGYLILFDASGDVTAQSSRLQTVLQSSVSDPSTLSYIDLRFGDHVYFK